MELIPIGTRVAHFGGGPQDGHGHGVIIGHNDRKPNRYFEERPTEAATMAAEGGILDALVNSLYDGVRCPYHVRWDPNPKFFEKHPHLLARFPNMQYEDFYGDEAVPLPVEVVA